MRGATLPPTPPDAMQRKTVSREASVTSGKSPARSPHPKAWDASFVKTPAPTLDEAASFRASSSRDRAERVSREKHAHMEARAELLSLIAEAAADADVLGEAFSGKEGDVPGPGACPASRPASAAAAMREIGARRDRERRRRRTARDARRRCGTCAGSREKPPPSSGREGRPGPPPSGDPPERRVWREGERDRAAAEPRHARRGASNAARDRGGAGGSRAPSRGAGVHRREQGALALKLAQEKTAARLRGRSGSRY